MQSLSEVVRPERLDEALALLAESAGQALPLGGGTSLALARPARITRLVDLSALGLDGIAEQSGTLALGATVRMQALAAAPLLGPAGQLLRAAAASVGSRLIRNAVTLAGNVVQVFPWSDLPVALLVLDAEVLVAAHGQAPRALPIATFLAEHPRKALAPHDLVTGFRVAPLGAATAVAYDKFRLTETDYALASVAVRLQHDPTGRCGDVRIAIGGVRPLPERAAAAEARLRGVALTPALLAEAAHDAAANLRPRQDIRASAAYVSDVVATLVRRALTRCAHALGTEGFA